MRKANTTDLFKIARLVQELDLKEDFFNSQNNEEDLSKIGFSFVFDIIGKASSKEAEKKIYECLSGPFEMDPEDIGKMEIDKLFEALVECFNFKTVVNFIKRVNK